MTYLDFLRDKNIQAKVSIFCSVFGGGFGCLAPGNLFAYSSREGQSYLAPENESIADFLQTLQKSVEKQKNLIVENWPPYQYDPDYLC